MRYKVAVAWGVVLAAAAGAYAIQKAYGKPAMNMDPRGPAAAATKVPVAVAAAEVVPLADMATYTGTVAAYAEEDVYPRVMGRIVEMRVYAGDRVEAGQVVARLDDVELGSKVREAAAAVAAAEANLAQMEADVLAARHGVAQMERELAMAGAELAAAGRGVAQMERELAMVEAEAGYQQGVAARDERLFGKGAVSQQEAENSRAMAAAAAAKVQAAREKVEQMKAMVAAAEAKLDAARAKLDQAKAMETSAVRKRDAMAAMLAQSQAMLRTNDVVRDYVNIRAAAAGYVAKRLIAPGTLVQPGMAILKIAQLDRVRFQANVADRDVARLRVGSPVRVRPAAGDGLLDLRVTSISPFAEGPSRTAVVEAVAENPGRRFLLGQYVVVEFELGDRLPVVAVPKVAVQRTGDQAYVWALGSETASRRPVKVGPADAERVGILEGLQAGARVIVAGHENLHEGAQVAVANGPSRAAAGSPGGLEDGREHRGHAMAAEGGRSDLRIDLSTIPATPRVGDARLRIQVKDGGGSPVSDAKVEVAPGMAGMPGPKVAARAARDGGVYEATVNLGMAGPWTVDVVVTRPRGGAASAKFNLEVK